MLLAKAFLTGTMLFNTNAMSIERSLPKNMFDLWFSAFTGKFGGKFAYHLNQEWEQKMNPPHIAFKFHIKHERLFSQKKGFKYLHIPKWFE